MTYDAFISYSHAADQNLARGLERSLQRFAKPWYKLRAMDVFRDEGNLNLSPHLWGSIQQALDNSRFFLYMASPGAAQSKWVAREVEYWKTHRDREKMIILLTDGDLVWDDARGDFDGARSTAIPEALHGAFHEEPFYLDLRWARNGEELSLENGRFKQHVVQIAAALRNESVEDMIGEEVEQHRRTMRVRNAAIVTLSILLCAALGFAGWAMHERNVAREQTKQATLRLLSLQAENEWERTKEGREGPATAQFLYENLPEDPLSRAVIFRVLYSSYAGISMQRRLPDYGPLKDVQFAPTGDRVLFGLAGGELVLTDLNGQEIARYPSAHGASLASSMCVGTDNVVATYDDGSASVWSDAGAAELEPPGPERVRAVVSRNLTCFVTYTGNAAVLHHADGSQIARLTVADGELLHGLSVSPDGGRIGVLVENNAGACRLDLYSGEGEALGTISGLLGWTGDQAGCLGREAVFAPDSREILLHGAEGPPMLIDLTGKIKTRFEYDKPFVDRAAFTPTGRVLTSFSPVSYGEVVIWEPDGERVATLSHVNLVNTFDASTDGTIATGSDDRSVKLWSADGIEIFKRTVADENEGVRHVEFSPDGLWLLVVQGDLEWSHVSVELLSLDLSRVRKIRTYDFKQPSPLVQNLIW